MMLDRLRVTCVALDAADERTTRGALVAADADVREEFIDIIRAEAHGVVWPSVVVTQQRALMGTRITVSGLAFRDTTGGGNER